MRYLCEYCHPTYCGSKRCAPYHYGDGSRAAGCDICVKVIAAVACERTIENRLTANVLLAILAFALLWYGAIFLRPLFS